MRGPLRTVGTVEVVGGVVGEVVGGTVGVVGVVGSPKPRKSMSSALLDAVFSHLGDAETTRVETSGLDAKNTPAAAADVAALARSADALVLSFPLYVDGLPSHLLRLLEVVGEELREMEPAGCANGATGRGAVASDCGAAPGGEASTDGEKTDGAGVAAKGSPVVYAVVNCGFFEPEHTVLAIEQLRLWCDGAGLTFGRALALGGGGMGGNARFRIGRGPLRRAGKVAKVLARDILASERGETLFVKIGIPRFLYILGGHAGWRAAAKKRGLTEDDLRKAVKDVPPDSL